MLEPDQDVTGERTATAARPFATVALVVLATQSFYLFHDTARADPDVWPLWGLLAGAAAWVFLRPASPASAGFTTRGLLPGLVLVAVAIAASLACLAVGWSIGAFEFAVGVSRLAPDLVGDFVLRVLCFYAVVLLGEELAFRSILQSEAIRRYGAFFGIVLVALLFAAYRVPFSVRVGLVDVRPDSFELDRMGLVLLRGFLDGLALGLLFRLRRNLFATALFAWYLLATPVLLLGNAEEALEPMFFLVGHGTTFDAVVWASVAAPVIILAIANLARGGGDELPEVSTPEWLVRNASFTAGDTPTDP